jgi:hypothetical protein
MPRGRAGWPVACARVAKAEPTSRTSVSPTVPFAQPTATNAGRVSRWIFTRKTPSAEGRGVLTVGVWPSL